jgi:arylsulfatase
MAANRWVRHAFLIVPAQPLVATYLKTFQDFPPSQKPASLNLGVVMEKMLTPLSK